MFKRNKVWPIAGAAMLLALIASSGGRSAAQINQQPVPAGWQVIAGLLPGDVTLNSVYIPRTVDTPAGVFVAGSNAAGHGVVYVLRQRGFGGPWSSTLEQSFPAPLRALVWLNGANIWAVGDSGLIVHRDGSGWHQLNSPVAGANLNAIQMFGNGEEGWAAGSVLDNSTKQPQPTLLHYKNGQWQQDNSIPGSGDIASLSFVADGSAGWLVGAIGIWHYQNGSWGQENVPAPCAAVSCGTGLNAVRAVSSDEAWAVGSRSASCNTCMPQPYAIHRSGGNWQVVLPDAGIAGTPPSTDPFTAPQLNAAFFSDASFGLAVGYVAHSRTRTSPSIASPLLLRYQGGKWSYDPLPDTAGILMSVYAQGTTAALAVGANGLVLSYGYGNRIEPSPTPNPATRVDDPHDPNVTYFPSTGHTLRGVFRDYWQAHGGLAQFGYPITEQFIEGSGTITSYTVQYFERNRFELHPENQPPYNVLLGLLGRTVTAGHEGELPFQRTPAMMNPAALYFSETGHNLIGVFRDYWQAHGGLAIYGYPISEQFKEVSKTDGKAYLVQYFERNRFEYHPELPDPYKVSLGLLGVQVLQQRGWLP